MRGGWLFLVLVSIPSPVHAGLYLSSESYADMPAQWRGFLLDQRALRALGSPGTATTDASPFRLKYENEATRIQEKAKAAPLSANDLADLGALHLRLGNLDQALNILRPAQREHPNHFALAANLGTAWHLRGDYAAASDALRDAVRLAPGKWLHAEELHLKLVRERLQQKRPGQELDNLFGVRYVGHSGDFVPGILADAERKKLPARAVALVQQLALWLPADGPLLWQLAELANAHGDIRTATSFMEGCVGQFAMSAPELRRRRLLLKEAIDTLPKLAVGDKTDHKPEHAGSLSFRSRKPLISSLVDLPLPPIHATGINAVPWEVFTGTTFEGKFPPRFPAYLRDLQGKLVSLNGFMQPLREEADAAAFLLIEFPVGCWYCEMPDLVGIVRIELPPGETLLIERGLKRVVGRLALNTTDPEDFLFTLKDAKLAPVD